MLALLVLGFCFLMLTLLVLMRLSDWFTDWLDRSASNDIDLAIDTEAERRRRVAQWTNGEWK